MTEAQLDNMLGLCEMAIAAAYGKPALCCTCQTTCVRRQAGDKYFHWQVLWGFLGDDGVYSVCALSLSELLREIRMKGESDKRASQIAAESPRLIPCHEHRLLSCDAVVL